MPKYEVIGKVTATVYAIVEADSPGEAVETVADDIFIGDYCGNGGCNKLVGVCDSDDVKASIEADDIDWEDDPREIED